MLQTAYAFHRPGRFQLEAAIQSAVTARASGEAVDAAVVERLHVALVAVAPTLGARVALAAATGDARGAAAGLAALDEIDGAGSFGPYWATRAHLLAAAGRRADAAAAYDRAIALVEGASERRWLAARRSAQRLI